MDKNAKRLVPAMLKRGIISLLGIIIVTILYVIHHLKFKEILSEVQNVYINRAFLAVFIVLIALWLQNISSAAFNWYRGFADKTNWDDDFLPLLKRVVNLIIWTIALLVVLSNFGININALIAALGVGSLAIALAAQDTIANIIAGFLIMIDRPFRIGDKIQLPSGERVDVVDIGVRRSKFLSEEGAVIIVPNLDLSKSKITNFTYKKEKR